MSAPKAAQSPTECSASTVVAAARVRRCVTKLASRGSSTSKKRRRCAGALLSSSRRLVKPRTSCITLTATWGGAPCSSPSTPPASSCSPATRSLPPSALASALGRSVELSFAGGGGGGGGGCQFASSLTSFCSWASESSVSSRSQRLSAAADRSKARNTPPMPCAKPRDWRSSCSHASASVSVCAKSGGWSSSVGMPRLSLVAIASHRALASAPKQPWGQPTPSIRR
mmetsp:Transcript_41623/g.88832  ORF Transcript_41623/g.88832 Transcript_41623/m.88832 type:complete len:227 (-) Transcript_41623:418-1098(-)